MLAVGTRRVFDELALTVRLAAAVSTSPTVKASAPVVPSSLIVWSAMSVIVGRSFSGVTVSSERVHRRAAVRVGDRDGDRGRPELVAAGVTVTVRLAPLPPNTMFAFGTGRVRRTAADHQVPAAVSTSPTVNASAAVFPSSMIVWSAMSLIVGRSFAAVTVTGTCPGRAAVRVGHRDRDRGRPELVRRRRDRHRPARAAAAEHDVGIRHQGRVRRAAAHRQVPAAVSTSPTVKASAPVVAVLGDRLVRDVADRGQVVCRRDRQQERVHAGRCPRPSP